MMKELIKTFKVDISKLKRAIFIPIPNTSEKKFLFFSKIEKFITWYPVFSHSFFEDKHLFRNGETAKESYQKITSTLQESKLMKFPSFIKIVRTKNKEKIYFKLKGTKDLFEKYNTFAKNISDIQKVPLYTFICSRCGQLHLLIPREFVLQIDKSNGNLALFCRKCSIEDKKIGLIFKTTYTNISDFSEYKKDYVPLLAEISEIMDLLENTIKKRLMEYIFHKKHSSN